MRPQVRYTAARIGIVLETLFVATWLTCGPARAERGTEPKCGASVGQHIVLASDETDPDVFVWDTRERLGEFSSDHWGSFALIMAHTVLVAPGTHAVVTRCIARAVHDRRTGAVRDAVGIYVAGGKYRGRYGWVIASDAHTGSAPRYQAHR